MKNLEPIKQPQTPQDEAEYFLTNLKSASTLNVIENSDTLLAIKSFVDADADKFGGFFKKEDGSLTFEMFEMGKKHIFSCSFPKVAAVEAVRMLNNPYFYEFIPFNGANVIEVKESVLNQFILMGYNAKVGAFSKKPYLTYTYIPTTEAGLAKNYTIVGPKKPAQKQAF